MSKNTALGERMKDYEMRSQSYLPRRTYTIVRVDGKGFSKFTKKMNKPFDDNFKDAMIQTAIEMAKLFHPKMVYYQSDEISLVFTDFDTIETQQMYDGKIQKVVSLTASAATAFFNQSRLAKFVIDNRNDYVGDLKSIPSVGMFDSRVFCIPDYEEVLNYFVWRQKDATRNSISMAAHEALGHKACMNKSGEEKQELMFQEKGINWNDYADVYKRGVVVAKQEVSIQAVYDGTGNGVTTRNVWKPIETPIFTKDREFFSEFIPKI